MYNLKMIYLGNELNVNIPYYISDGKSNKLRSNLLLPFICFNNPGGIDCPQTSSLPRGGLIKYRSLESLNTSKINDSIISNLDPEYVKTLNPSPSRDILSVLPRMSNLLDFLICINNKHIINYHETKIRHYHIIFNERDQLNDEYVQFFDKTYNMLESVKDEVYDKTNDLYKNELLLILQSYILNFKKLDFIKFEPVDISFNINKIVDIKYFNQNIIKPTVCNKSKVSIVNSVNTNFYSTISEILSIEMKDKLLSECIKKLKLYPNLDIIKVDEKQHIIFLKDFSDLIIESPKKLSLTEQLNRFQARCYKKYLKYKKKYLSLKDNIK